MTSILKSLLLAAAAYTLALPALAQGRDPAQQAVPASVQRGIPGAGHAALAPLVGSWRVELSIYGTMGRSPDLPPIVSHDIRTTRVWIETDSTSRTRPKAQWRDSHTGAEVGSDTATSTAAMNG